MKSKWIRMCASLLCILAVFSMTVSANSAQTHWVGVSATGVLVNEENCPIEVEHEVLTFNIQEFPANYYSTQEEFLAYEATVTAEYTFVNPADFAVTATLAFPFGNAPDYGEDYRDGADIGKYGIRINGSDTDVVLRHTYSHPNDEFELERDLMMLQDGFADDPFYSEALGVTKYTYQTKGVDLEAYDAAYAALDLSADPEKTKVFMEGCNGGKTLDDCIRVGGFVEKDNDYVLYVIGEPLREMPQWSIYSDTSGEIKIDGTVELTKTETTNFRNFALCNYSDDSGVSETDWYNAIVRSLNLNEWSYGFIGPDFGFDLTNQLMRWYEYEITLHPGESITNRVTAPLYPAIDADYDPAVYHYTYLLSPAKTWADLGTLDITINTPHYLIENNLQEYAKLENGYYLSLTDLPDEELEFTLSTVEKPLSKEKQFDQAVFNVISGFALLFAAGLITRVKKKGDDQSSNNAPPANSIKLIK